MDNKGHRSMPTRSTRSSNTSPLVSLDDKKRQKRNGKFICDFPSCSGSNYYSLQSYCYDKCRPFRYFHLSCARDYIRAQGGSRLIQKRCYFCLRDLFLRLHANPLYYSVRPKVNATSVPKVDAGKVLLF